MPARIGRYANPARFERIAYVIFPWLSGTTFILLVTGLFWSLFIAPPDYQHGEAVRIMFVHVPAAWSAMLCYTLLVIASVIFLRYGHITADLAARAAAPIGLTFTLIALFTGSVWGKPMWGAWWVWDARLTSTFIQFFIFLGIIALRHVIADPTRGGRLTALFTLCGAVNIPIIHYSVIWWNSLHQPPSLSLSQGSALHPEILYPLLVMSCAFTALLALLTLIGILTELNSRRADALIFSKAQSNPGLTPPPALTHAADVGIS